MQEVLKKQESYLKLIVDNTKESVVVQKKDALGTLNSIDKNIADLHMTIYEQLDSVVENLKTLNDSVIETFVAMDDIKKTLNSSINTLVQKPESAQNTARAEKNLSQEENVEAVRREETLVKVQTEQADTLKKILEALTVNKEEPKGATSPLLRIGVLGTALALGLGAVAGYLKGYVKVLQAIGSGLYKALDYFSGGRITKAIDVLSTKVIAIVNSVTTKVVTLVDGVYEFMSKTFIRIGRVLSDVPLKIMTFFDDLLLKLPKSIGGPILNFIDNFSKNISKPILDFIKEVPTRIVAFIDDFKKLFVVLGETSKPFVDVVKFFKDTFTKIGAFFGSIKSYFDDFFKIVGKVMPIFEKLALPITVILAIWDTVKGAIEGFEKEGIVGAIKGAITGLFNSLIGGLLDLIKGAISWIAGALGFTAVEKALDSFSFQDLFKKVIDSVFGVVSSITDWISGKIDAVKTFFGFGDSKEKAQNRVVNSERRLQDAKTADTMGAIGINEKGGTATSTMLVNGVADKESARRELQSRGYRDMTEDERAAYFKRLESDVKAAEDALRKVEDMPTIKDVLLDPMTKLMDSIKNAFSTYIVEPIKDAMKKLSDVWNSLNIEDMMKQITGLANDYIISPVKSVFEKITSLIDEYIAKPLKDFFSPLVDFFKAIPTKLASIFEYVGIPEIKYTIPVINKDITIGPFYPFRPKQDDYEVGAKQELKQTSSSKTGDKSSFTEEISSVGRESTDILQSRETSSQTPDGKTQYSFERLLSYFDTKTGKSTISAQGQGLEKQLSALGIKLDSADNIAEISNRALDKIKLSSQKGMGSIEASLDILKEDLAYQKLSWFDKRKVDVGYANALDLIKSDKYKTATTTVEPVKTNQAPPAQTGTAGTSVIGRDTSAEAAGAQQEQQAYDKLTWWDKRKVDVGIAKASELIKDDKYKSVVPAAVAPNRESNANVYDRTIRNEQMRGEPTQQAPVIVNAATTNVANNRQNVVAPVPTRNQDSAMRGYVERRNVLI